MKQIIPFKKDVFFKTQVNEITSISLEHNYTTNDNNIINGEFIIQGDYKMTEASINKEIFSFKLPFDIAIDDVYDHNDCTCNISDFFYEIIDSEVLRTNIELTIENLQYKFIEPVEDNCLEKNVLRSDIYQETTVEEILENINQPTTTDENVPLFNTNTTMDLFKQLDEEEVFSTYKVYIVREGDLIEEILEKYEIDKETLSLYNNLESIELGDKLIIPTK